MLNKDTKLKLIPFNKKGSGIHIKKENKGKFTDYCGGNVTNECIQRGKNSSNPAIRKRATFAANARKWKHEKGGILKAQKGTGNILRRRNLPGYDDGKDNVQEYKHYEGQRGSEWYINPDGSITTIDGRTGGSFYLPEVTVTPQGGYVGHKKDPIQSYFHSEDIPTYANALTGGFMLNLSPTQWARRAYDFANGNLTAENWFGGNRGIVSNKFEKEHPYISAGINLVTDAITLGGASALKSPAKFIWNSGKVFQNRFPYNPKGFYRAVGRDAIEDANTTGVIKGTDYYNKIPYFSYNSKPYPSRGYYIDGSSAPVEWTSTRNVANTSDWKLYPVTPAERIPNVSPSDLAPLNHPITDVLHEAIPWKNGSFQVPTEGFSYWKKHPIIGWRQHQFKKQGGKL